MAVLTIPNVFVTGTTINAAPFNTNFNAVATSVNSIDNTNIGAAGIFASQLLPTTAAQATFGGLIGYAFLAPSVGTVPLTVSGITSQTADLFDVTLTSGGTKAFAIAATGAAAFSSPVTATAFLLTGTTASSFNIGQDGTNTQFRPYTAAGGFAFVNGANSANAPLQAAQITANGGLLIATNNGTYSAAGSASSGDAVFQRSPSVGFMWMGGASNNISLDFNSSNPNQLSIIRTGVGYCNFSAGTYTNLSDASKKTNVAPITQALDTLAQLKPSSYNWIHDGQADFGFIAQEMEAVLPQITRTDKDGTKGIVYSGITALNSAAIIELAARFKAYVGAHP